MNSKMFALLEINLYCQKENNNLVISEFLNLTIWLKCLTIITIIAYE